MSQVPMRLSDAEAAGQLLFVGIEATALTDDLRRNLRRISPAGIILFARNIVDAPQVGVLCRELASVLRVPPFLAIDQEGGRVNRLKGIFPSIPPNLRLARAAAAEDLVREHARQTGRGLALLGFNLNFAPVLDLSDESASNGIGDRAYGTDPRIVTKLARIFLTTQSVEGVTGCGKHFPGLGAGSVDSHVDLPQVDRSSRDIWELDLAPYRQLGEACPIIMVGHAYYPALQGKERCPATLSREVVTDLLRGRLRFTGVSLTDDLEMGAVDQGQPAGEVTLRALEAGNDLFMFCKDWNRVEEAHFTLLRALQTGRFPSRRFDLSLERILSLKGGPVESRDFHDFSPDSLREVCLALAGLERQVG